MPRQTKTSGLFTSITYPALLNAYPARSLRDANKNFLRTFPILDPARADIRGFPLLGNRLDEGEHFPLPLITMQSVLLLRRQTKAGADAQICWSPQQTTYTSRGIHEIVSSAMLLARMQRSLEMFEPIFDQNLNHEMYVPYPDWKPANKPILGNEDCWLSTSAFRSGSTKPMARLKGLDVQMDQAFFRLAYGLPEALKLRLGHRTCANRRCVNPWHSYTTAAAEQIREHLTKAMPVWMNLAGADAESTWYDLGKPKPPVPIPSLVGFIWDSSWAHWEDSILQILKARQAHATDEDPAFRPLRVVGQDSNEQLPQMTESEARQAIMSLNNEDKELFSQILRKRLANGEGIPTNLEMINLIKTERAPQAMHVLPSEAPNREPSDASPPERPSLPAPSDLPSLDNLLTLTPRDLEGVPDTAVPQGASQN